MATATKKENLTISIREYTDSQGVAKKVWKTIGELITWEDGKQSFEMWGPTGSTRGSVFSQDNNQQQGAQQGQQQQQRQQPNGIIPAQNNTPISNGGFGQAPQQQQAPQQSAGGFIDQDVPFAKFDY